MSTEASNSIWTPLISGGLAGAVFSLIVNSAISTWRRWRIRCWLKCEEDTEWHADVASVRVFNDSPYPLTGCWAYIAIHGVDNGDIYEKGPELSHYPKGTTLKLDKAHEDRLHWAIGNFPPMVDICPGERQALRVFRLGSQREWIGIFTECAKSSGSNEVLYRVFLKPDKVYKGCLKIVSRDIEAKEFQIIIDVSNQDHPLIIEAAT